MRIGWGVIGAGGIAEKRTIPEGILPAKNAKLVALMDVEENKLEQVSVKYPQARCYTREKDLLEDKDVQAVYIATPAYLHFRQTVQAAEAGKHVLCEKPMTTNLKNAEKMVNACEKNQVNLSIGYMMRYHAYHQRIKKIIKEGVLGKIIFTHARFSCWYPPIRGAWRQDPELGGGGSLMDMGSHCLDLLDMLMGPIVEISCYTGNLIHNYLVEDTAGVMLKFKQGQLGFIESNFNIPSRLSQSYLEIEAEKGTIVAIGTMSQESTGKALIKKIKDNGTLNEERISPLLVNMYKAEIEKFSQSIIEKGALTYSPEVELRKFKLILASYESASTGKSVKIC